MSNVFLVQCKQTSPARLVASQLTHQPNPDRIFFLKSLSLDFFFCGYCGAFFGLANGHELLRFYDNVFKLPSTIYKRRTLRAARRLPNTNV